MSRSRFFDFISDSVIAIRAPLVLDNGNPVRVDDVRFFYMHLIIDGLKFASAFKPNFEWSEEQPSVPKGQAVYHHCYVGARGRADQS